MKNQKTFPKKFPNIPETVFVAPGEKKFKETRGIKNVLRKKIVSLLKLLPKCSRKESPKGPGGGQQIKLLVCLKRNLGGGQQREKRNTP